MIAGHSDMPNNIHWNPTLDRYMCFVRPNNWAGPGKLRTCYVFEQVAGCPSLQGLSLIIHRLG